jgi:hypothetical protein
MKLSVQYARSGIVGARPAGDIGAKKKGKTKANRIASKRRDSDKRCNPGQTYEEPKRRLNSKGKQNG